MLALSHMHALVVTLLLASPLTSLRAGAERSAAAPRGSPPGESRRGGFVLDEGGSTLAPEAAFTRDRCLGAGAAGAALGALGLVIGGGAALGIAEIIKLSDRANTSASKQFGNFAIPSGAIAGGIAGLATGMIGAWELGEGLAAQPPVTR